MMPRAKQDIARAMTRTRYAHTYFLIHSLVYADGLQMDWFSDKLNKLIEEGKRALGTEVVVMSENQEDEVDDGRGDWVEEEYSASRASSSVHRTRRRPGNLDLFPSSAHSSTFQSGSLSARTDRSPLANTQSPLFNDDTNDMSPELRESMEKARSAYNQRRGLGLRPQ